MIHGKKLAQTLLKRLQRRLMMLPVMAPQLQLF